MASYFQQKPIPAEVYVMGNASISGKSQVGGLKH
jgi:hypothetical protein